jgi:large subunit ribosomal protein L22
MQVTAKLKNLRIAPRKVRLVADLIRGMDAKEAVLQLERKTKRSCEPMKKLLLSAIANGENNLGLDKDNLYVFNVLVGEGPTMKRWMPKAFGRAGEILKRTSHVNLILEERVEGKGRKTPEEMEKIRKEKLDKKKKEEREMRERQTEKDGEKNQEKTRDNKKEGSSQDKEKELEKSKSDVSKKSWGSRVFRRKSM